ncbi:54S ribosomal protein L31, mitochondrial [Wickerhamiella sorbophila]|uniref:54S ribosomal protein L31, mitochondrial n=1 Tax=Wickerhamiella sorbophila TaxID=45607 RepID=A0A2T0FC25_9ASCO|nr:54S ribosomal protein L31, mitochondrial [Wickerhamiella sorbophila]PRT52564.1 54S ribosomal protein L31, mitochondrial [Wickerhamiella sorbophila]
MLGPFRGSPVRMGGYLWKIPYKMSQPQKARQRSRLRAVDQTISTVAKGLASEGLTIHKIVRFDKELPKESEMPAKDKYWIFNKTSINYRKGAHRQPKFTKVTNRVPPEGF